jgi:hypothetical protein
MIALDFTVKGAPGTTGRVMTIDDREGFVSSPTPVFQNGEVIKRPLRGRQFIDLIASGFAFAASNAARVVEQHAHAVRISFKLLV